MSEKSVVLHTEGPAVFGDLTVTGFATTRTATEIGDAFAAVLRQRYPEAQVTTAVSVTPDGVEGERE